MPTFEEYLNSEENTENKERQLKIINKILFSDETVQKIKNISREIKILAVAEVYCPDCRAVVSFLEKFSELNDKIKIEYSTREEAHDLLLKATGITRIPTLFADNGKKSEVFLTEFPKVVQKHMSENPEQFDEIKYNFRTGKYNKEIEKELVSYLVSL